MNRESHTKPGAAAYPPVPYPAHTATAVCTGGTLSDSNPGQKIQKTMMTASSKMEHNLQNRGKARHISSLHSPLTPGGRTHILISEKKQNTIKKTA